MLRQELVYIIVFLQALSIGCGSDQGRSCPAGTPGCACGEDGSCDQGLVCVDDVCTGESRVGLSVSSAQARSCEVLLVESGEGGEIVGVLADDAVKAAHVRRGKNSAVTFISNTDDRIGSGSVQLRVAGSEKGGVDVRKSSCADKEGKPIEAAEVTLIE